MESVAIGLLVLVFVFIAYSLLLEKIESIKLKQDIDFAIINKIIEFHKVNLEGLETIANNHNEFIVKFVNRLDKFETRLEKVENEFLSTIDKQADLVQDFTEWNTEARAEGKRMINYYRSNLKLTEKNISELLEKLKNKE